MELESDEKFEVAQREFIDAYVAYVRSDHEYDVRKRLTDESLNKLHSAEQRWAAARAKFNMMVS